MMVNTQKVSAWKQQNGEASVEQEKELNFCFKNN